MRAVTIMIIITAAIKAEVQSDLQQIVSNFPTIFPDGHVLPTTIVFQTPTQSANVSLARDLANSLLKNAIINNPGSDAELLGISDVTETESGGLSTLTYRIEKAGNAAQRRSAADDAELVATSREAVAEDRRLSSNDDNDFTDAVSSAGDDIDLIDSDDNNSRAAESSGIGGLYARYKRYQRRQQQKRLAVPLKDLNTESINQVFRAVTAGSIGKQGTNIGYAKKALLKGEPGNDTTDLPRLEKMRHWHPIPT